VTNPPGDDPATQGDTAMEQQPIAQASPSRGIGDRLEEFARAQGQRLSQALWEEEVTTW
jgi:hypothetical protein